MTKKVISVRDLSFIYPRATKKALDEVNFELNPGEFVLLCGSSGSGKTTLAKCLNGIIPHLSVGDMYGNVNVDGLNTAEVEIHDLSSHIGMVFQNPEDQIFSIRVSDEVALGVECQGYVHDEIVKRVDYAMEKLRIRDIKNRLTFSLSGGQKQKVSIASNLAILPNIIILDDPTTDLDPISKQEVMDILQELKNEILLDVPDSDQKQKMTFFVIEHDLTDLMEFVDRVIVMHEGKIVLNGEPGQIFYENYEYLDKIGVRIPDHIRIAKYVMDQGIDSNGVKYPVKMKDILAFLHSALKSGKVKFPEMTYRDYRIKTQEKVAEVKNLSFKYPSSKGMILKDINFDIYKGEFLAIIGHNGSGKTTIMKNLLGILHPSSGDVVINGHNTRDTEISKLILDIGYVFQNPDNQLFCNTVREEIEFGLKNNHFEAEKIKELTDRAISIVGLEEKQGDHPFSLSRGERQRLAVATMLVSNPKIILLDEPTTGLDERDLMGILELMEELIEFHNGTLIMVTHDMEVVSEYATRVLVVEGGQIVMDGDVLTLFKNNAEALKALKLKPTIISQVSTALAAQGMPYIPDWKFFMKQRIDGIVKELEPNPDSTSKV
ncbi:MAG: energy-coupling factor transporter ATPase [Anaerolineaceae bacterium]|nr:energy-coupling factor transporter ATPase [Anaerolineaceae bacterium]